MLRYLIEKEFKQLFRNSFLPKLVFIFPCMIMILMPWAANLEIKNINLNVVDNDHSVLSRRLVDKIGVSTYFRLTDLPGTYEEALHAVEEGSADVILEIPRHFERDWMKGTPSSLLIAAVRKLMIEGVEVSYVWTEIGVLFFMAVVLLAISLKKFKNRLE